MAMRSATTLLLTLFAALSLAACGGGGGGTADIEASGGTYVIGGDDGDGTGDDTEPPVDPPTEDSRAAEVLALVNQARADNGLSPVAWHDGAAAVALLHSEDMRDREFFDHVNPDGLNPGDRLAEGGVDLTGWGENIAMGYLTAVHVMEGWMNSPGHRANILEPAWTHLGIGITEAVTPGPYWTQNFIRVPD
jgi:uncharacterized protein YkwD